MASIRFGAALLVTAALGSTPAWGTEWWRATSLVGDPVYVDRESVTQVEVHSELMRAWIAVVRPKVDRLGVKSNRELRYFDCTGRTVALKAYYDYDPQGRLKTSETIDDRDLEWENAPTRSRNAALLTFACDDDDSHEGEDRFNLEGASYARAGALPPISSEESPRATAAARRPSRRTVNGATVQQ